MNGFYRMDYEGRSDTGAGAIALVNGKIAGLDIGGGIYKGSYSIDQSTNELTGTVDVSFPQGGQLVTGAVIPPGGHFTVPLRLNAGQMTSQIIQLQLPSGAISVRLSRVADL